MKLRIVCFEDSSRDRDSYKKAFRKYDVEFKFYKDPQKEWNVTKAKSKEILEFNPNFIIVDLLDDKENIKEAGIRIIRQLKEHPETLKIPVIACSVLFTNTTEGISLIERVRQMGAKPLRKSRDRFPKAERFLSLIQEGEY